MNQAIRRKRWTPLAIFAMIVGFILWWPLGLAVIGYILWQGDTFGEKACLMRQEQFTSAVAATDCALLVIPEKTVVFILERNPKLREALQ